jgi:hypothetical protein
MQSDTSTTPATDTTGSHRHYNSAVVASQDKSVESMVLETDIELKHIWFFLSLTPTKRGLAPAQQQIAELIKIIRRDMPLCYEVKKLMCVIKISNPDHVRSIDKLLAISEVFDKHPVSMLAWYQADDLNRYRRKMIQDYGHKQPVRLEMVRVVREVLFKDVNSVTVGDSHQDC